MNDNKSKFPIGELAQSASPSSPIVDEIAEKKKNQKKSLIKMGAMGVLTLILLIFSSLSWFTMNSQVESGGMSIKSQGMPYTIQTRIESGYYKEKWDKIGSEAMEWQVTLKNNFDNNPNDTYNDEDEPGLEPGDSGMLEFRVNPNISDSITVDCVFEFKAYLETPVLDQQGNQTLDANSNPVTRITEIDDAKLLGYVETHIMLFSGYDAKTGKYTGLIGTDDKLRRVLTNQTYKKDDTDYTTIYWKWPMHLEELTSHDNTKIIYAPSERTSVINYIAANRTGFFKDCNDTEQQVITDLTALSTAYDNSIYNHYNMRYDNADLDIGNNISYVMLAMNVEQKSE